LLEDRLERTVGPQTGWKEGRQVVLGLNGALGPQDCSEKEADGFGEGGAAVLHPRRERVTACPCRDYPNGGSSPNKSGYEKC
jgi:hypothetical protein